MKQTRDKNDQHMKTPGIPLLVSLFCFAVPVVWGAASEPGSSASVLHNAASDSDADGLEDAFAGVCARSRNFDLAYLLLKRFQ